MYDGDPRPLIDSPADIAVFLLFVCVFALGVIALTHRLVAGSTKPQPRPKTPEELANEEAWYRAEQRRLSAVAEYEMAHAQLEEQRNFFRQHGRK